MTDTETDTRWAPTGHPVRNFAVACLSLGLVAVVVWWAGLLAPRVDYGFGDPLDDAISFEIENRAPLAVTIVEVAFEDEAAISVDERLSGSERATIRVPFPPSACDSREAPEVAVRIRTPLGMERTETVNVGFGVDNSCTDGRLGEAVDEPEG
jgi:hypothetical protein